MISQKLFLSEKFIFSVLLIANVFGFWYFEESSVLKFFVVLFGLIGLGLIWRKKMEKPSFISSLLFPALLVLYLGVFTFYNFVYEINLPLYMIMVAILALATISFAMVLTMDEANVLLGKINFPVFIAIIGLVILEVFLSLYFWPLPIELKSLILTLIFYLIFSIVYIYIHNMLSLKRVVGFFVVSIIIIIITFLISWFSV